MKDLIIDANRAVVYGLEASPVKGFTPIDETNLATSEATIVADWIASGITEDMINKVMVIYNEETEEVAGITNTTYPISKLVWNKGLEELYYTSQTFAAVADIDLNDTALIDVSNFKLLGSGITDFSIDFSEVDKKQIGFGIQFENKQQTLKYQTEPVIMMRNKVIVNDGVRVIYVPEGTEKTTFIASVKIMNGASDISGTIIKEANGTNKQLAANVEAQFGANDAVTWELSYYDGDTAIPSSNISGNGLLTIGNSEIKPLKITARSVADRTKSAYAIVVIDDNAEYAKSIRLDTVTYTSQWDEQKRNETIRTYTVKAYITTGKKTETGTEHLAAKNEVQWKVNGSVVEAKADGSLEFSIYANAYDGKPISIVATTVKRDQSGNLLSSNATIPSFTFEKREYVEPSGSFNALQLITSSSKLNE